MINSWAIQRRYQRRKTFAKAFRQMLADSADLFLNQIIIVQQPFTGGHDTGLFTGVKLIAVLGNDGFIVTKSFQKIIRVLIR